MTDYNDARSGMYTAVVMFGFGALIFGILMVLGVVDAIGSLFSGRDVATSTGISLGVGLLASGVFAVLSISSMRTLRRWQRINDRPIMAWGTMGEPRRTGTKINGRYLHDIPLTVQPSQGGAYNAKTNWFFPMDLRNFARPGARVVVRIDPEDMASVLIDWDQTRASWGMPPPPRD